MPEYTYQCNAVVKIANNPTNAIFEVYFKIFVTETCYFDLLLMG